MVAAPWNFVAAQPSVEQPVVQIRLDVDAARADQLAHTARATVRLLTDWLGPAPFSELVVVEDAATSHVVGTVTVEKRWLELERDPATERSLIAGIAAQFWSEAMSRSLAERWFGEALSRYTYTRAIDTILEGRQYWSTRFFGGFIPYAQRSLPLSPFVGRARGHIPSFPGQSSSIEAQEARAVTALFTLERVIGWPALQPALLEWRAKSRSSDAEPADLARILSEQRGDDFRWFVDEALRTDNVFDYGIENVSSRPEGPRFSVNVTLRRFGNAIFGVANGTVGPSLPVVITLADGTQVEEQWPGGRATLALDYVASSPAVRVTVDPDAMLLLDGDRANNTRIVRDVPRTAVGNRAALWWLTWLEAAMLTCLALV